MMHEEASVSIFSAPGASFLQLLMHHTGGDASSQLARS